MIGVRLHLTGRSVMKRFFRKKILWPVSNLKPMVVKLVGQ